MSENVFKMQQKWGGHHCLCSPWIVFQSCGSEWKNADQLFMKKLKVREETPKDPSGVKQTQTSG